MNTYNLRINIKLNPGPQSQGYGAKIAVKTEEDQWLNSKSALVVPVSIESAFHEGIEGRLKMLALLSAIQSNVKQKATLLFTEWAHCNIYALGHQKSLEQARQELMNKSEALQQWLLPLAHGFNIAFWHKDIYGSPEFIQAKEYFREILLLDPKVRDLVQKDVLESYTPSRQRICPNQDNYYLSAQKDMLEYLAYQIVFSNRSFAFQMYPGKELSSAIYLQQQDVIKMKSIYVFVSIEKKFKGHGDNFINHYDKQPNAI